MNDRLKFITHKGKKILYIDYTNLKAIKPEEKQILLDTIAELKNEAPNLTEPTLFLTDARNSSANSEVMSALKDVAAFIKPLNVVKKECIVGVEGIKKTLLNFVNFFARSNVIPFKTLEKAKEWLIAD